jgi:prolipoprotein diacylglyceryl transferase
LSAYIFCRIKKLDYVQLLDCLAPGVLVAQAVGRLGNWFNQELFGAPTNLPWALSVSPETAANTICPGGIVCSPTTTFHPTFLYEMILDLFSAAAIIIIERKVRLKLGQSFALYIIFYSFCRFIVEQFRIDYAHIIFGLRIHAWVSIIAFLLGIFAFIRFNKQRRRH